MADSTTTTRLVNDSIVPQLRALTTAINKASRQSSRAANRTCFMACVTAALTVVIASVSVIEWIKFFRPPTPPTQIISVPDKD